MDKPGEKWKMIGGNMALIQVNEIIKMRNCEVDSTLFQLEVSEKSKSRGLCRANNNN